MPGLKEILSPGGSLSRFVPGYEHREQQIDMLGDVEAAFHESRIALIEAGTGVGKSMAYLLPALYWASKHKEKILLSTHTINLQEQLLHKDIPLAAKALGVELKAVLVKGMSNYLCLRKLEDARHEKQTWPDKEHDELEKIEAWAENTRDGSLAELKFAPSSATWERLCAESDTCNFRKCPFYKKCHFFNARQEAQDAQILVSNHSMLFADLAQRQGENEAGLLPAYKRVVLDEAHRIEDVATEFFARKVSYFSLLKLMGRFGTEKHGKLAQLKDKLFTHYQKHTPGEMLPILARLNMDLPGLRREMQHRATDLFQALADFVQTDDLMGERKLRMLAHHRQQASWQALCPLAKEAIESATRFRLSARALMEDLSLIQDEKLQEKIQGSVFEIQALLRRLEEAFASIENFIFHDCVKGNVRWIESKPLKNLINIHLIEAKLDLAELLVKNLFEAFPTTILTSATLTAHQDFTYFKERIGLDKLEGKEIIEKSYQSPFDYPKQARLIVPNDLPHPNAPEFMAAAIKTIGEALIACRGQAFVLFTSHQMMNECAFALHEKLALHRFPLLVQGQNSRKALLDQFRNTKYAVLFGTDAFWEGVDVAGEALRCVILVKLPFKVPSEPLIQARTEAITENGGDAFKQFSLPGAIVKFKQGFGRLIRHKKDRGCIVCLDSRLIDRPYGKLFLKSLPPCGQSFIPAEKLGDEMREFYKKTHYLIKS